MSVVYIVRTHVMREHEAEWTRWQLEEHITNLLGVTGYLGVQRFAEIGVPQSYLNIWRLTTREAQATAEYTSASLTPWFDRIRPYYDVEVDFSLEATPTEAQGDTSWRSSARALAVDRGVPGADTSRSRVALSARYEQSLAADPTVVRVLRLDQLTAGGVLEPRSAATDVLLSYLRAVPDEPSTLPPPPAGVERRWYTALGPYLTAS